MRLPSVGDWNVTPSSLMSARCSSDTIWAPQRACRVGEAGRGGRGWCAAWCAPHAPQTPQRACSACTEGLSKGQRCPMSGQITMPGAHAPGGRARGRRKCQRRNAQPSASVHLSASCPRSMPFARTRPCKQPHLKAPGVGQHAAWPVDEAVQPAHLSHQLAACMDSRGRQALRVCTHSSGAAAQSHSIHTGTGVVAPAKRRSSGCMPPYPSAGLGAG